MKRFFKTLALAAFAVFGLASCEDVPSPFNLPNNNGGTEETVVDPKGDGTAANPFNVKGLTQWIEANESTAKGKEVYIEGIISSIKSLDVSKYTRAQYYINDTESTTGQFYIYNGLYLNGANFTANDQIKVGDKVLIKGSIDQYNGSFQIGQNSTILSLNGSTEGGSNDTPVDAIEKTCAEAAEICKALDDNASSEETFSITGYITDVFATVSKGQQSFWMADTKDGGKVIQAYWANLPEGVESFTKGSKVKIVGKLLKYVNNSGAVTCEVKNADVTILEEGTGTGDVPSDAIEVNCAKAAELCEALADNASSTETYAITGYITDVFATISKGQQSFWMADTKDGGKIIQAYWANLPSGIASFTAGAKVKIVGKLLKYVNNSGAVTYEVKNADVTILEEGTGSGDVPGNAIEVNCAKAAELCEALADNASSTETYAVTGYITDVFATISKGQQSFWMADTKDGGKVLQAYWANLPSGVESFVAGSKVKITGNLLKYVNKNTGAVTAEIKNADVQILEAGNGSTGEDKPNTDTYANGISVNDNVMTWTNANVPVSQRSEIITMSEQGYENAQEVRQITTNLFTVEFAKGTAEKNTPKYYDAGSTVRIYPGNSVTVSSNMSNLSIYRVVINCDVYNGTICVGQTTATLECTANKMTYVNAGSGTGTATQLRIKDMTIYYDDSAVNTKGQRFVKRK